MKHLKRIISLLIVMIIVFGMAIAGSADTTPKGSITVNDKGTSGNYAGYLIMYSTNSREDTSRFAYTANDKYIDIIYSTIKNVSVAEAEMLESDVKHEQILRYLENVELNDNDMRSFADKLYRNIRNAGLEPDETFIGEKKTETTQGYWLIADVTDLDGALNNSNSVIIIDTVGVEDIEVKVKKSIPTVVNKVAETNDSAQRTDYVSTYDAPQWQDGADYDITDEMWFKVTGTVAENISSYETYFYSFHVQMTNMTFVDNSVKVFIDGKNYTNRFTVEWNEQEKKLKVFVDDLFSIRDMNDKVVVNADSKIVLKYKATLDETAVTGSDGNPNVAYLEYSNDPYDSESTGNTSSDTVIVFTYKIIVNKVIGAKASDDEPESPDTVETFDPIETGDNITPYGKRLNGAGFTLYKMNALGVYEPVGEEKRGGSIFEFYGIDAGTYKLVESTVPDGFNKSDDIEFVVVSVYDVESEYSQLRALYALDKNNKNITLSENVQKGVFIADLNDGSLMTYVKNYSGTNMPSTGGMGTVLIYILGAVLFIGSLILLVIKLRKKSSEKQ